MCDADFTEEAQPQGQVENQPNATPDSLASEVQRLKQGYASRLADERPLSHSVAEAYRQVIAARQRNKR